jgi:8-oxo-dGTP pyrophosphatase MutT (NUDIX family)
MSDKPKHASMVGLTHTVGWWEEGPVSMPDVRILLCRTQKNPDYWQPVGGGALPGETSVETAVREVGEEARLIIDPRDLIQRDSHPSKTGGVVSFFTTEISSVRQLWDIEIQLSKCPELLDTQVWASVNWMTLKTMPGTTLFLKEIIMEGV